jgi:NhaP-type Na+/H+ or K+/H+ antiporter
MRLVFNHAQMISGSGPQVAILAGTPGLLDLARADLEKRLRKMAKRLDLAGKTALFTALAAEYPAVDFSAARNLFGF